MELFDTDSSSTGAAMTGDYSTFFRLFAEVSKAIHSGERSSEILETIVTRIKDILEAKGCIFWMFDHSKKKITSKFSDGFSYRSLEEVDYDILVRIFDRTLGQPE
jgi:hypothetical protein